MLGRWIVIANAVTLFAGTWLLADTVNAMVGHSLDGAAPPSSAPSWSARAAPRDPDALLAPIRRNVFDHGEPIPGEERDEPAVIAEACTSIAVLSTVIDTSDPRRSLATVRSGSDIDVVGVGEKVDDATVAAVGDEWDVATTRFAGAIVLARADGRLEVCHAGTDLPSASVPAEPNAAAGVRKIDGHHFEITSAAVADALGGGMERLSQGVRVVPYFEGGTPRGFKLYAIQPDSLLASIGLQNGDVLQRVDGYEITNPEQALRVYGLLKNERNLTVDVGRDGSTTTLSYSIR